VTIQDIIDATDRMEELMTWHLMAPLVDHDGGDEDDRYFKERQVYRAIRQPGHTWREGNRWYYVRKVTLQPLPFSFMEHRDPGDED
jgi:hypothetical protein